VNLNSLPLARTVVTPWQRLRQFGNHVFAWLPMLLLIAGLLWSVWLVRSTPATDPLPAVKVPTQEADYDIRGFTLKIYDLQGQLKSSMTGVSAVHSPQTLTTLVEKPKVLIYKQGRVTSASAHQALANEDGSEVQLMGKAVIYREPSEEAPQAFEMRSEFLHLFANTDVVQTDLPVEIKRGDNSFKANSMRADNLNQVLGMSGRVKAVLHPNKEE
jgi:lipopolysaccharide export system protein LptC